MTGQIQLKRARVAVVGAGGLGCPLLQYLAGAGIGILIAHINTDVVGHLTIIDHDTVSLSNLHRQILHTSGRVGMNKAQSTAISLRA
jgi:adenylyltransferase and sulfurtransferase